MTPDGGTPTFKYDAAGRLFREPDALGKDTTEYSYDAAGRLISVETLVRDYFGTKTSSSNKALKNFVLLQIVTFFPKS